MLKGKTVVLGVTGGIAAYKSAALTSLLVKAGAQVQVIMTEHARQFIAPLTFESLPGRRCLTDTFDRNHEYSTEHVELAKEADVVMIAPATANIIAKIAHGMADDMLTTTMLACDCPKIVAPAMNTRMYENPVTQDNIRKLEEYASITFLVTGADSTAFVELLDAQDKVVRRRSLTDGGYADFYFLNPGKYCARLVNDRNGNGIWDTGNFEKGEQPEEVYYYNMILEPKANWDLDKQSWDIHAIPLDKQKLDELKKQKPDEDKKKKDRDRNSQRRR